MPSGAVLRAYLTGHGSHALGGPVFLLKIGSEFLLGPKMTVQCQNRANCSGVYRYQTRVYDKKVGGPARALLAAETSETSTNLNRTPVQYRVKVDLVEADVGATKWAPPPARSLEPRRSAVLISGWATGAPGRGGRRARTVSGCVNSAFLNHFHTFYGPSVQTMDTQLGARQGRRAPTIHRDRAQRFEKAVWRAGGSGTPIAR